MARFKLSPVTICLIFIFGWFSGSLFLLCIYSKTSSGQSLRTSPPPLSPLDISHPKNNSLHHQKLPLASFKQYIFLVWPLLVTDFSYINYKAFESILIHYPTAKIRIILPSTTDNHHYKTTILFSTSHFLKYNKKGYDIEIKSTYNYDFLDGLGLEYWRQVEYFLNGIKLMVPFHVSMFIAANMLYKQGGVFTDFTFLFTAPLVSPSFPSTSQYSLYRLGHTCIYTWVVFEYLLL